MQCMRGTYGRTVLLFTLTHHAQAVFHSLQHHSLTFSLRTALEFFLLVCAVTLDLVEVTHRAVLCADPTRQGFLSQWSPFRTTGVPHRDFIDRYSESMGLG